MIREELKDISKNLNFVRDILLTWNFEMFEFNENDRTGICTLLNQIISSVDGVKDEILPIDENEMLRKRLGIEEFENAVSAVSAV